MTPRQIITTVDIPEPNLLHKRGLNNSVHSGKRQEKKKGGFLLFLTIKLKTSDYRCVDKNGSKERKSLFYSLRGIYGKQSLCLEFYIKVSYTTQLSFLQFVSCS